MRRLLIVIPAYNEATAIGEVIASLPRKIARIGRVDVLVIDDGSTDATADVGKSKGVKVLRHLINRGLGAALATGFAYALREGYDLVVTFDADGQHRAKDIPGLIEPLIQHQADVVIGSRLLNVGSMPWRRKIINQLSNWLTLILFNFRTTDSQSGLRAFTREALSKLSIRSQKMEVSSEFFKEFNRLKLKIAEVPVESVYTSYSLKKGQPITNAPHVVWKLLLQQFT